MARRLSVDDRLTELQSALDESHDGAITALVDRGLGDSSFRIVALAAKFASDRLVYDAVPNLIAAYQRFLDKAVKRDPNCLAKNAIVRALHTLDCDDVEFWLAAIRYRQMEPVWGGTEDKAVDLRSSAAMGLVSSGFPRALVELAELLTDSESPVRAGAARAIACGNPREAELLLRSKVLTGDEDPFVIGECFTGLLAIEPDESPAFVARYLDGDDETYETAALALGESRLPRSLEFLQAAWGEVYVPLDRRRVLVRAAALHRTDEAFDWLLTLVEQGEARIAADIIEVLAIYRHNDKLARRLRALLDSREDRETRAAYESFWTQTTSG